VTLVFRLALQLYLRLLLRSRVIGATRVPDGAALLLANRSSPFDALLLAAALGRRVVVLGGPARPRGPFQQALASVLDLRTAGDDPAAELERAARDALADRSLVLALGSDQPAHPPCPFELRGAMRLAASQKLLPVVPVSSDAFWAHTLRFLRGLGPCRRAFACRAATVRVGKAFAPGAATPPALRQEFDDLDEMALSARTEINGHLGWSCLASLSRGPWRGFVVDRVPARRAVSRGMTLAVAIALSRRWRRTIPGRRVGVVLPPCIGSAVANLALALARRVPVNLNFTLGADAVRACFRKAGMRRVVSAPALRERFPQFPWPADTLDIVAEIRACPRWQILFWLALVWLLPARLLALLLGVPRTGGREEAGLLFTSGSVGEPKGVALTHRNIMGNVAQIAAVGFLRDEYTMLASLPIFHSFGFTVNLWYPLLRGMRMVTVPSPLEVRTIAEAIHAEKVDVSFGTSTFLRPYLKRAEPAQLASLRFVVGGAEKLSPDLARAFEERFGVRILEGYGLTETSPVVTANLPNLADLASKESPCWRLGSVGRLLPGIAARIAHPETGAILAPTAEGMLHLRGANIFEGYLGEPERSREVLRNGWFVTGDIARFDEDGFLHIVGRVSRFSKIGGEMVPHGTIEQKVIELFGGRDDEGQAFAVVGVRDEAKGEALVLLAAREVTPDQLREKLLAAGFPPLWVPRQVLRVEKIPALPTGKLDVRGCEELGRRARPSP
jgi:acyl-[acyl-carrier-protein]-phospholipid O-acyltransferase/long-chain-fatty-acid--[acyl-carrier-protein] ligase